MGLPKSMMPSSDTITLLNPSGRVITVPAHMKTELLKKGFRLIMNPKEEYYPAYDHKNSTWGQGLTVVENIEPSNFLEVDLV